MKFTVERLPQAKAEIEFLEQAQKDLLKIEYQKIEQQGIEFVKVKPLQKKIYVKKTQKTPKETIKLAEKRLREI